MLRENVKHQEQRADHLGAVGRRENYRFSGGMALRADANTAWRAGLTGRCLFVLLAGSFPR